MRNKVLCSVAFAFDCNFSFQKELIKYNTYEFVFHNGGEEKYEIIEGFINSHSDADAFIQNAFEFCLSISAKNDFCSFNFIELFIAGGIDDKTNLFEKLPSIRIPRNQSNTNVDFYHLTKLESLEQKIVASLLNDSKSTNNPFFKFLCRWKILEVPINKKTRRTSNWINGILKTNPNIIKYRERIIEMKNQGVNIGQYFSDNYRNAIAHISKPPHFSSYNFQHYRSVGTANFDIEPFVDYFIKSEIDFKNLYFNSNILKRK